jgi:hypothetical protein
MITHDTLPHPIWRTATVSFAEVQIELPPEERNPLEQFSGTTPDTDPESNCASVIQQIA